jgi:hypothetical protein
MIYTILYNAKCVFLCLATSCTGNKMERRRRSSNSPNSGFSRIDRLLDSSSSIPTLVDRYENSFIHWTASFEGARSIFGSFSSSPLCERPTATAAASP